MLEVTERDKDCCDVVKCASQHTVLENIVNSKASELMDSLSVLVEFGYIVGGIPYHLNNFPILNSIKDTITGQ